ncbi:ABC transporter [Candidatus Gottesmanbacteria bacterium RIFCSPHIGHO2_01_FULL_39_10]|uniref:ABC transporter n=1 Tax=Candidatus Gottesmanbacteria bacterium RIFCSPHIGHO2_01_FULL_39_10 TaxID=1798375 RepID=A0A1F5ZRR4_9BACT|nr:MAG: ABC transporter [Candidatus Gottesmanbacteria bacterium RIFCSPHIGHO2_01_FULL_39_10]
MHSIVIKNLKKYYQVYQKKPGLLGSISSLISRKYKTVKAVDDISFSINEGELVGFIGPNGAGKTTTLKCLSGLLYPNHGQISVLNFYPYDRKNEFLKNIALVMGQKNQLWWDLPPIDSFHLNKEVYEIDDEQFKKTLDELTNLLSLGNLISVPVRKLSLGERMKCELIGALLHRPKILFLDEPTIGLDVVMQKTIRDFIAAYNHRFKATIILTSHYMEDVKELCKRVIIIDKGKLLFDGNLSDIVKKYAPEKLLSITFDKFVNIRDLANIGDIKKYEYPHAIIAVKREDTSKIAALLLEKFSIDDLNIEEPDIEDIIRRVFSKK